MNQLKLEKPLPKQWPTSEEIQILAHVLTLCIIPSCPKETTSLPLPEITDEWLQNKLNRGPSTIARGEDSLNYYTLKLAGSSYFSWLRSCMHAVLKNTAPP